MRAISISVGSSISGEARKIGPDTLIASSWTSSRTTDGGALTSDAMRSARSARTSLLGPRQQALDHAVEQRDVLRLKCCGALRKQDAELANGLRAALRGSRP